MRPAVPTVRALRPALIGVLLLAAAAGAGARAAGGATRATAPLLDPAARVNVFVGTSGTAVGGPIDTFPGASLPFGMIQWSPDTPSAPAGGGYNYTDHALTGFSLTHLSGPGCSVAGDIRILPTSGALRAPATAEQPFSHRDERAAPGWYAVRLRRGINAELTVTRRSGLGRFTFPAGSRAHLLFDVGSNQAGVTAAHFQLDGPRQVSGSATGGAFCGAPDRYTVYFVARFNRPVSGSGAWRGAALMPGARRIDGLNTGGWVSFATNRHRSVQVEVALSYVSRADALENLRAAPDRWHLEAMRRRATGIWNGLLGRIAVSGGTPAQQATFYTALYHTLLAPTLYSDVNGEYRGFDGKVHRLAAGHAEYANYSGWDIYRTEVPLIALIAPHRVSDMLQSLLDEGAQGGWLAKWPLANGYTGVMGGDAADIILAGGWAFGARAFDGREALREMLKGATDTRDPPGQGWYVERPGLAQYLARGYVDDDLTSSAAPVPNGSSETLEYAEDDFSIARFAAEHGAMRQARTFLRRSMNWQNVFDTATGSVSARNAAGAFVATPVNSNGQRGFQEGNAAQYTWMVPQDLGDLTAAMGGRLAARHRLDAFFTQLNAGQSAPYAWLGNEPSLGAPWVYLALGAPWRTEEVVRSAINTLYADTPAGIPGNDDLGTMSAWYVWSAIGLYPQIPAVRGLAIGSPLFPHVTVSSPGGVTLDIDAPRAAADRPYVRSLSLDGRATQHTWLDLPQRGTVRLRFELGRTPNLLWGTDRHDGPPSFSAGAPHFPPAVAIRLAGTTRQTIAPPGQHAGAAFTASLAANATAVALHWRAQVPAGWQVQPASGRLALGPGASRTVRLRLTSSPSVAPGYYHLVVHARAANGAPLAATTLILRAAKATQRLPLRYIASSADNAVVPLDTTTLATGPQIAVGQNPAAVVTDATGRRVYVANQGSNTVSVIQASSQQVMGSVPVGSAPDALALSADGRTLWVANGGSNTVEPVDTASLQPGPPIVVGTGPAALAFSPHGRTLYVTDPGSNSLTAIDTATRTVRATFPAGAGPTGIAVSPDGRTVYVADTLASQVLPIAAASGVPGTPMATGLSPRQLALSPRGHTLYVADLAVDTLSVIDTASGASRAPVHIGAGPIAVAFSRSGRRAYALVSQTGRCAVIAPATGRVLASIPVAPLPVALSGGTD
ncbi:MAG: GH92 family glycosyl hydrolase [Steroidobacteraceae bacterium]